jgi:NAD(P)-dependent dehydrogenase (short-subunit alcohol dehydrogenase family)
VSWTSLINFSGIGLGLVAFFLARPSSTIIVSVRNPQDPSALALHKLPVGSSSSLILIPIDFSFNESVASGIAEIKTKHGINTLDIVISNAGLGAVFPKVLDAKLEDMLPHYQVNVVGNVALFQAVYPLLEKAKEPKFITIGSSAGMLTNMLTVSSNCQQYHTNLFFADDVQEPKCCIWSNEICLTFHYQEDPHGE